MSWIITPQQPVPVDPVFNNVSLLLHGNGTNGSTTITDNSPTPKTVTAVGNAQISTAQSKFGGASIAFDGTGDYLTVPASNDFEFSKDLTCEAFIFLGSGYLSATRTIFSQRPSGFSFRVSSTGQLYAFSASGGNGDAVTGTTVLSELTWYHVACTRTNGIFTIWLNGVSEGSGSAFLGTLPSGNNLSIGRRPDNNSDFFLGYMDEVRITKGVARYTANFTPPAAPFPDI
jgi:hypothetical protein